MSQRSENSVVSERYNSAEKMYYQKNVGKKILANLRLSLALIMRAFKFGEVITPTKCSKFLIEKLRTFCLLLKDQFDLDLSLDS
ncbi:MAG: hypothetical protein ACI857_002853 [Arenicella sp.]|jgi:hypothetical protein